MSKLLTTSSKHYRQMVQTFAFNAKKTDVNMADDMMMTAWTQACEQIVLCSNDSDITDWTPLLVTAKDLWEALWI